jgi:dolichyldiphosphatase
MTLLQLTAVHYDAGDRIGHLLALCTLLPILISFSIIILFIVNRQLASIQLGIGLIGNEVLNAVLKRWLAHPRPNHSQRSDYGMPSSHAQFSGFFAMYMLLLLWWRWRIGSFIKRFIYSTVVLVGSLLVCYSRIYLHYHTEEQVLVGILVGTVVAILYYWLCYRLISRPWLIAQIKRSALLRLLQVHDCDHLPDLLGLHYEQAMQHNNKRQSVD